MVTERGFFQQNKYVWSSYDEWYTKTDAFKLTLLTTEELCWAIAFLGCKVRSLTLSDEKESIVDITESLQKNVFVNDEVLPTPTYR